MIIRAEKTSNYTRIPNDFLLDETICDKARETLARLLSRPDNWNLNVNYLVKTGKDGHTAARSAIRELGAAGYIQREVSRHANGRIIGVEYIIRESPVKSCGDRPAPEQQALPCDKTDIPEVPDNTNEITFMDSEPEPIAQVAPEPEPSSQEIQVQRAYIEDIRVGDNRMQETQNKGTAPIITNDIKQTLKVITTTTPEPGVECLGNVFNGSLCEFLRSALRYFPSTSKDS